ncbi:L,D-transpeptidase family protein [Porticoccus sp.]
MADTQHSRATLAVATTRFSSLEQAFVYYNKLALSGRWSAISAGPLLKLGDSHEQVGQLRQHLSWSGDYHPEVPAAKGDGYFDEPLHQALLRFQERHGAAKVDGILGPETRNLLNVPPWIRADQILLNINRQEQFGATAGPRYVQVNIPAYRLKLVDDGTVLLDMKTIVGRQSRQTPVFSRVLRSLVVNPSWSVPRSIAMKDILPKWKRDNSYLDKQNLQVLSGWQVPSVVVPNSAIDLAKMYRGAEYYRLWQPPGPGNTLGRVKFEVSGSGSIYLHDTHSRQLFAVGRRGFSSGCIRLEKPLELAEQLLILANAAQPGELDALFETTRTRHIRFDNPVELHVTYWTAWLDESGTLYFGDDLYRRDEAVLTESGAGQVAAG